MLQLFNEVIEVMYANNEQDLRCCLEYLGKFTRDWKIKEESMRHVEYYFIATETICNLMKYAVTYNSNIVLERILISLVTEKVLIVSKFTLNAIVNSNEHLEIFCNFWYHLILLMDTVPSSRVQTLNLFFKFRGQDLFTLAAINTFDVDEIFIKELQLVFSEVMTQATAMLQNISDFTKIDNLRKKLLEIHLKKDAVEDAELTKIFNTFIDIKMKYINDYNNNLLITMSDIIVKLNEEKVSIDSSFLVMLLAIFTDLFDPTKIQSVNSISRASSILKKNYCFVTPEINEKFICWWMSKNSPKQEDYQRVILKYITRYKLNI